MATPTVRLCYKVINFIVLNTLFGLNSFDIVNPNEFTVFFRAKKDKTNNRNEAVLRISFPLPIKQKNKDPKRS